ncbi:MAG: AurF N-oxygenase family protein [Myxococcota bacterium]
MIPVDSQRVSASELQPEHGNLAENAVLRRLSDNWPRRAAVKRSEPDLDDLFEPTRPDYPERLLPFRSHPRYATFSQSTRDRLLSWAWIAFNKNVMDIEQHVVNPGFALLANGVFETGLGEPAVAALVQAMVDEQYHTLLHFKANRVTRHQRRASMPESALPLAHKARLHRERLGAASEPWQRDLVSLAFTTVAEVSINAYLNLIADDEDIQPINRAVATLHNRDEYCHSSIVVEIAKAAFQRLPPEQRRFFLTALVDGLEAFSVNDYTTWYRILELVEIPDGRKILDEVQTDPSRKRLLQDFSGLHRLFQEMGVLDQITFDWSTVSIA